MHHEGRNTGSYEKSFLGTERVSEFKLTVPLEFYCILAKLNSTLEIIEGQKSLSGHKNNNIYITPGRRQSKTILKNLRMWIKNSCKQCFCQPFVASRASNGN